MNPHARISLTLVAGTSIAASTPAPAEHGSRLCDPLDAAWLQANDLSGRAARRLAYRLARHARSRLTPTGRSLPDERMPPCAAAR